MSNVVQFLEALARNPKPMSAEDLATAVANAELEPAARQAILSRDPDGLNRVLGGRLNVMCLVVPAENDEPQEGEEREGEPPAEQAPESRAA
ncbi:hypothetical protein ACFPOA_13195 [Lysobacter niabensis]|uniref:hypothetical protein n=1 Tax=Agrilutibacter niabensis TaxID=380628 RepID=UPI00362408C4